MYGFAKIASARRFASLANPLLPCANSNDVGGRSKRIDEIPAGKKAKHPHGNEPHGPNNKKPEKNLPANRMSRRTTQKFEQHSLDPFRQPLPEQVPCGRRLDCPKLR